MILNTCWRQASLRTRKGHALWDPMWIRPGPPPWPSFLHSARYSTYLRRPDIAFAFDIDGVLLRSSTPIPGARETLSYLQQQNIPFILLTNGGGTHESDRVADLSHKLGIPLHEGMFVQSHTPFEALAVEEGLQDQSILVVGGDGDNCRQVAHRYGFKNVVLPGDILMADPSVWPFAQVFQSYYKDFARPLPAPIDPKNPDKSLRIGAVFVFNDPRDWALDAQIILDVLLSSRGILGTYSFKNNNPDLPNRGYQQDGQPPLYFSNPDLWWANQYHLPRLGQGGFREALEGIWSAVTGGSAKGVKLHKTIIGKPYQSTYEFAEKRLHQHRRTLLKDPQAPAVKTVVMVGDNEHSDIRGANEYVSKLGSKWCSVLVKTGVFRGGPLVRTPTHVAKDVSDAVQWALHHYNKSS
ncbi:MAG: hypothetical protein M1823_004191 [Watsoniomyces obsoletus]|nr:MAG: hypothetical protein M1823_004191 [Watsoniomyces obsoletus]